MIVKPKNENIKRFVPLRKEFKVNIDTRIHRKQQKKIIFISHTFNEKLQ